MSDGGQKPDHSDSGATAPVKTRRSRTRRLGCGLVLLVWFALLLTPCALFYLGANGEIRLEHGEIPQPHAHPLLLVSLVSESKDRGLRFEASWIASRPEDGRLCVQTAVRFLLWEYSGGNQNVSFCDCYSRDSIADSWELDATYSDACK